MSDKPTAQKAREAVEDFANRNIPVREVIVEGRSFRLVIGKPQEPDGYDMVDLKR